MHRITGGIIGNSWRSGRDEIGLEIHPDLALKREENAGKAKGYRPGHASHRRCLA